MKLGSGCLADNFEGIVYKTLTAVEADKLRSHQHELQGISAIRKLFGSPEKDKKLSIPCLFFHVGNDFQQARGELTLYDARAKGRIAGLHMRAPEYRLYYQPNNVTQLMEEDDMLFLAKRKDGSALFTIVSRDSDDKTLLAWLFGQSKECDQDKFSSVPQHYMTKEMLSASVLDLFMAMGFKVPSGNDYLEEMLDTFGASFPTTQAFSSFARKKSAYPHASDGKPDDVLINWLNTEEILFKTLERHLLSLKLKTPLTPDSFIQEAKSVMNRRYMRAGQSLENQFQQILIDREISFSHTPTTEGKSRPDFIFPSIEAYKDDNFDAQLLYMLGVKTTCKDRWRQILAEAARIEKKHLLTLELGISKNQTDEMQRHKVQLVLPRCYHDSYSKEQQLWLMDVEQFLTLVSSR